MGIAQFAGRALRSRLAVGLTAGLAGVAISGGIASATIPDANGVYTACYDGTTKTLRIVDTDASAPVDLTAVGCAGGQTIMWNKQGIQGPQGIQGIQGPQGIQGAQGLVGPAGKDGTSGTNGTNGQKGDLGPTGQKGDAGPAGLKGDVGPVGPSRTWIAQQADQAKMALGPEYTAVQTLQLAPGSYALTGKVTIENGDTPNLAIGCELLMGVDQVKDKSGAFSQQAHAMQTLAVQSAFAVPQTLDPNAKVPVSMSCSAPGASAFNAVLSATQVQDLTPVTPAS